MTSSPAPLAVVEGIDVRYRLRRPRGTLVHAVQDVSFTITEGETVALVGESGSGKSTVAKAIVGLQPLSAGRITVCGIDLAQRTSRRRELASRVQMVFQDPYGSLNPSLTVKDILCEPIQVHQKLSRSQALAKIENLLNVVGMPPDSASRYPGNFSGGQRQRIAIARALSIEPRLVVCDEPTSALDVSTQAEVLGLLSELRVKFGLSYLFITHDLAIVRRFADRVIVLRDGQIVEQGSARDVCECPAHPYTQRLVAAALVPDPVLQAKRRAARLALAAPASSRPADPTTEESR